jgi:protein tyrosine phosphatase (PTP) superfamily phosphohydrolase (DUF442 family)
MIRPWLSALMCLQSPALPGAIEIRPGIFVVRGHAPEPETLDGLKSAGITHVIDLRKDDEGDLSKEAAVSKQAGAEYGRCPLDREPTDVALDAFRERLKALPKGARALMHCASGNRVGGALYAYWVLDTGMDPAEALPLAHHAGLANPSTEKAVLAYVARRGAP